MKTLEEFADSELCGAFREQEPVLIRFITSRVGSRAVAQDLTQEVFLRAGRSAWRNIADPRAFLFRIALNLVSSYKAQTRRRAELVDEVKDLLWSGIDEVTPERKVMAAEELKRVTEVLESLPERTRNILLQCRFEGMTKREIASGLGISYQAVDGHLQRALTRLIEADDPPDNK